jgi:redox-sensitive bicupin YhaK (pirin superfamily)
MYERIVRQNYNPGDFNQRPNSAKRLIIPPGNWEAADPFLLMVEDFFHTPEGFPDHPHRGIETVTFVLGGELRHADNRGNSGVLGATDVQWMTAGGGIIHAELPHQKSTVHSLQLWLNMPSDRKHIEPGYQDLHGADATIANDDGVSVRVLSGNIDGIEASTINVVPVLYLEVAMEAGKRVALPVPAAYNGFVHVLEGSILAGPGARSGNSGDVLWLDYPEHESGESTLTIAAQTRARLLVVTGRPIREPVVAYGPFVMNSAQEIRDAFDDYHAGRFGGPTPAALEADAAAAEAAETSP